MMARLGDRVHFLHLCNVLRESEGIMGSFHEAEHLGGGNTHAWVQVYVPGAGWLEFDPTNGIVGSRDLIRVAVVREPRQAVPLSGSWTGVAADCLGMEVSIRVTSDEATGPQR